MDSQFTKDNQVVINNLSMELIQLNLLQHPFFIDKGKNFFEKIEYILSNEVLFGMEDTTSSGNPLVSSINIERVQINFIYEGSVIIINSIDMKTFCTILGIILEVKYKLDALNRRYYNLSTEEELIEYRNKFNGACDGNKLANEIAFSICNFDKGSEAMRMYLEQFNNLCRINWELNSEIMIK